MRFSLRPGLLATGALICALLPATAAAAAPPTPQQLEAQGIRGIIIQREPGLTAAERGELRDAADVDHVRNLSLPRTEVVRAEPGELTEALATLDADPNVRFAEPDGPVHALAAPNDPYWPSLWGMENTGQSGGTVDADIDALTAWATTTGGGHTVAVVDTGVQDDHPDLVDRTTLGNIGERGGGRETNGVDDDNDGLIDDWRGWDFVDGDNDPDDEEGHGTHVAGTIAATRENGTGVAGVAPDARILPVRVLDASGSGFDSDVVAGFDYAGRLGVRVVNASLGGSSPSVAAQLAIASHPETLYIVAAGNDGTNNEVAGAYPCNYTAANLICVGSTGRTDARSSFSNYGTTSVDLSAPGEAIISTYPTSVYASSQGTSMATPHVAGVAALLLARAPGLTAAQAKAALLGGGDVKAALSSFSVTGRRLNAAGALVAAGALPADGDLDGVATSIDNCPAAANAPQGDVDFDGVGDSCDSTYSPPTAPPVVDPPVEPTTPATPVVLPPLERDDPDAGAVGPKLLKLSRRGTVVAGCRGSRCKQTVQLSYRLSDDTAVTLELVRHTCKRRCRDVTQATRALSGSEGTNRVTVTRKVGSRTLPRGSYRAVLTVGEGGAGQHSQTSFTVR